MDAVSSPQLPSECGRQKCLPARGLYCKHQWLDSYTHCVTLRCGLKGHVHISLVVHRTNCKLHDQSGILPFIKIINNNLEKAQKRGFKSGSCSYSLLVANYGGIMVVPTQHPYCVIYPTVYETKVPVEDQHHLTPGAILWGMCTGACMCHTLLQLADTQPAL